jgi:hypothetical protein
MTSLRHNSSAATIKTCSFTELTSSIVKELVYKEYAHYCALYVDPSGIEPLTSCLQGRRSPS